MPTKYNIILKNNSDKIWISENEVLTNLSIDQIVTFKIKYIKNISDYYLQEVEVELKDKSQSDLQKFRKTLSLNQIQDIQLGRKKIMFSKDIHFKDSFGYYLKVIHNEKNGDDTFFSSEKIKKEKDILIHERFLEILNWMKDDMKKIWDGNEDGFTEEDFDLCYNKISKK